MSKKWIILALFITVIIIGFSMIGPIMSNVEQAKYNVIKSDKNIEIREYSSIIVAEVLVKGERKDAIKTGFNILADYIFGNNKINTKIAMTSPVQQQSRKISMTKPVLQQKSNNVWKVNFIMPEEYAIDTLPKPNNEKIIIKKVPVKKYIVIKFSGMNSDENIKMNESRVKEYMSQNNIEAEAQPIYAFYNPPWTLPFLRRNEIMIEIKR